MTNSNYAKTNNLESGNVITSVTGTIEKLYESRNLVGVNGSFTLQAGKIGISGESLALTIFGDPIPLDAIGREVTFKSSQRDKGLNGVRFMIKNYPNKKTGERIIEDSIEVGKNGQVYFGDRPWTGGPIPPKGSTGATHDKNTNNDSGETVESLVRSLLGVHDLCNRIIREHYPNAPEETVRTYTASLFIEANKSGARNMPSEVTTQKKVDSEYPDDIHF